MTEFRKLLLLIFLFLLSGCSSNNQVRQTTHVNHHNNQTDKQHGNNEKQVITNYKTLIKTKKISSEINKISICYPEIAIFNTQEEKNLNLSFKRNAEEEYNNFIEFFKEEKRNANYDPEIYEYSKSCRYESLNNIISLIFDEYDYLGGVHGNYSTTFFNIIISSANIKQIQMNDIIKQDVNYKTVLSNWIVADLKKQGAEGGYIELDCADHCDIGEYINSFYFGSNGLNFIFDPYVAGCYAAGSLEVIIPYEKLRPLLRQEYINIVLNQ